MTFYKAMNGSEVIGVATSDALRRYQRKHNILVRAEAADAQCILINDVPCHGKWMKPMDASFYPCLDAAVVAISEEEYRLLLTPQADTAPDPQLDEAEDFSLEADSPYDSDGDRSTAEYAREKQAAALSALCRKRIMEGFDLTVSGKTMHFSLKTSDQLNLNAAALSLMSGSTEIPYHPDGEKFMLFSAEEMRSILCAADAHRLYHLAYFNSLKLWLNSMTRLSSIKAVEYGSEIPAKYQTLYLKSFSGGGAAMR